MGMIKNGISTITAKLQFARLAFGAAGSSGFEIDLQETQNGRPQLCGKHDNKHKVEWSSTLSSLPKNHTKLLLNMFAIAPWYGATGRRSINIVIDGDKDHPAFTSSAVASKKRACQRELLTWSQWAHRLKKLMPVPFSPILLAALARR